MGEEKGVEVVDVDMRDGKRRKKMKRRKDQDEQAAEMVKHETLVTYTASLD